MVSRLTGATAVNSSDRYLVSSGCKCGAIEIASEAPSNSVQASGSARSDSPPGGYGTTMLIGRAGFHWARAGSATTPNSTPITASRTSVNRSRRFENVPTLTEQGLPVVQEVWQGILAPPKTPKAVLKPQQ